MRRLFLLFFLVLLPAFAQNNVSVYVRAEMGSTFSGGSIVAQQIIPQGNGTPSLTFFFDSSGNANGPNGMGLPGTGTWQFRFCTTTGLCYNAEASFPGVPVFDITTIFTNAIASGGGGGTPGGGNGDIQINNGGIFGSGGPGSGHTANVGPLGNIAVKPPSANGICYASPAGNDSNDGLSWGTSKLTIRGCIVALPQGSVSPDTMGTGTVYVANNTLAHPTSGCGIWLMSPQDPNYGLPPACWILVPNGGISLDIEGVPSLSYGPIPHIGKAQILNGSSGVFDRNHPGFWASATNAAISLHNVSFVGSGREYVIGECSNNSRTGTCQASNMDFYNVGGGINELVGNGPCIDITGSSFWLWFKDWTCSGSDIVNPPTGDLAPAVLIDGHNNSGMGLIHFRDGATSGGGIKMYAGINILNNIYVENFTTEGTMGEPAVWVAASGQAGDNNANVFINNIEVADSTVNNPGVEVDVPGSGVTIQNVFGNTTGGGSQILGSAVVFSQYQNNLLFQTASPSSQQQVGFFNGHSVGQNDDIGRMFSPTAVRYANVAATSPGSWNATYGGAVSTITTGQTAPDGSTGAALISYSSGSGSTSYASFYINGNVPLTLGDYYLWEAWVKSGTSNGYVTHEPIQFTVNGDGYGAGDQCNNSNSGFSVGNWYPFFLGDGEWERVWGLCKVTANPSNGGVVLYAQVSNTQSLAVYAPTLIHIPAGTVSNDEAFAIASALQSYSNICTAGQLCTPSGPTGTGLIGLTAGVIPEASNTFPFVVNSSPQLDIGLTHSLGLTFAGTGGIWAPNGIVTAAGFTATGFSAGTFCLHSVNGVISTTVGDCSTGGTVTSVGQTVPSWLTVSGSPILTAGTLAITAATGQTSHQVIGTCNTLTSFQPCSLVPGDIPTLNQSTTGNAATATLAANSTAWGGVSLSGVAVSGQCPIASSSSAAAWGACGSGGGSSFTGMTTNGVAYATSSTGGTSTTPPTVNGQYACGYSVTGGVAVPPTCPLVSLTGGYLQLGSTSYTTQTVDNSTVIVHENNCSTAATFTLSTPTTVLNSFPVYSITNHCGNNDTIAASGGFTIQQGSNAATTTIPLNSATECRLIVDALNPTSRWIADCRPNGGPGSVAFSAVTSGTGTGTYAVGTGGSLAPSGTGTINANILNGVTLSGAAATGNCMVATSSSAADWGSCATLAFPATVTGGTTGHFTSFSASTTLAVNANLTDLSNTLTYAGTSGFLASLGPIEGGLSGGGVGEPFIFQEGTQPSSAANQDWCYASSSIHSILCNRNNTAYAQVTFGPSSSTTGDFPAFADGTGNTFVDSNIPATATGLNTAISTLPGCNTATYVYTPQGAGCVAPSGGGAANVNVLDYYTVNVSFSVRTSVAGDTDAFGFIPRYPGVYGHFFLNVGTADNTADTYNFAIYSCAVSGGVCTGTLVCSTGAIAGSTFASGVGLTAAIPFTSNCTLAQGGIYLFASSAITSNTLQLHPILASSFVTPFIKAQVAASSIPSTISSVTIAYALVNASGSPWFALEP